MIRKSSQNQAVKEMMEVHDFPKNEHMHIPQHTQTQIHSPFPSSESQFVFFWGYQKYFNVSWLQSNPLQLLVAILYHPCHKFHCRSGLCFDFIMPGSKPGTLEQFRVCTQVWVQQLAHLPRTGLYYLLPVLRESPAAASRGGLGFPRAVCAASSLRSKSKGNPRLGTNRSSTQGSRGVRWQLPGISLQHDCPWALKLLNVFAALRGLSAPSPLHRSQGPLAKGALWGSRPTGSDCGQRWLSISSLSVV